MQYILKNRNLSLLFLASGIFFFNEMLLVSTLPLYLSELGYSNFALGSVLGAFAVGVLALRPIAGMLTDRKTRKLSLIIALLVFSLTPPLYLMSDSFFYLLSIRFIHGIGMTFFSTASPTLVTDIVSAQHRGRVLGYMAIASILAMAMGPMVGISLFTHFGIPYVLAACSLTGVLGLVLVLMIREPLRNNKEQKKISFKKAVLTRIILVTSAVIFIEAQVYGSFLTFLPLLLENTGDQKTGLFFLIASVTTILCRFSLGHITDDYGRGPMFFYSFLIINASVVAVALVNSLAMLIAAALLYGLGATICRPTLVAMVADGSDPEARGRVYSFFYGAFDVGVISAGFTLGFLADLFGLRWMFLITAGLGLASAILFMLTIKPTVRKSILWTLTGK